MEKSLPPLMTTATAGHPPASPFLSIIVPVKDEEPNILMLLGEIRTMANSLGRSFEVIFVDDGSSDGTLGTLLEAQKDFPELRILKFRRNCGQTAALDAGIRQARGEWLTFLDGDGQNDPADIPLLLEEAARGGYDMVAGWRRGRRDTPMRRISSWIANHVRNSMLHDGIHDTGCTLKVVRHACLHRIKLFTGMHRFLPMLLQIEGYRIGQLPVHHRQRHAGKSKYGLRNRMFRAAYDLIAVYWMKRRALHYEIESHWEGIPSASAPARSVSPGEPRADL